MKRGGKEQGGNNNKTQLAAVLTVSPKSWNLLLSPRSTPAVVGPLFNPKRIAKSYIQAISFKLMKEWARNNFKAQKKKKMATTRNSQRFQRRVNGPILSKSERSLPDSRPQSDTWPRHGSFLAGAGRWRLYHIMVLLRFQGMWVLWKTKKESGTDSLLTHVTISNSFYLV